MPSPLARLLPALLALTCLPACSEPAPREITPWARAFSSTGSLQVLDSAVDSFSGNVALTGTFNGTVDLGGGPFDSSFGTDIFLLDLDADGRSSWGGHTGAASYQSGQGIAIAPNGDVIATGAFTNAVAFGGPTLSTKSQSSYLARFDPGGVLLWSTKLGDDLSVVTTSGVAVDREGNIVIAGSFSGDVALGGVSMVSPGQATFVAKLDGDGNPIFGRQFGGSGHTATAVGVDLLGNSVILGRNQGNLYVGDRKFVANGTETFIAKLDRTGDDLWFLEIPADPGYLASTSLAVSVTGEVVVCGTFSQSLRLGPLQASTPSFSSAGFVAKLSATGEPLWLHPLGTEGPNGTGAAAVALGETGQVFVTGEYIGAGDFGSGPLPPNEVSLSAYLCELDGAGNTLSTLTFNTPETTHSSGQTVTTDPAGGVILTGKFGKSARFAGTTLTMDNNGNSMFVARLKTPLAAP